MLSFSLEEETLRIVVVWMFFSGFGTSGKGMKRSPDKAITNAQALPEVFFHSLNFRNKIRSYSEGLAYRLRNRGLRSTFQKGERLDHNTAARRGGRRAPFLLFFDGKRGVSFQ